jgi:hypothetical protein
VSIATRLSKLERQSAALPHPFEQLSPAERLLRVMQLFQRFARENGKLEELDRVERRIGELQAYLKSGAVEPDVEAQIADELEELRRWRMQDRGGQRP